MKRVILASLLIVLSVVSRADCAEKSPFKPGKYGAGELKFVDGVPVVIVAGQPAEMGEQIGHLVGLNSPDPTPILHDFLKDIKLEGQLPTLKILAKQFKPSIPKDHLIEIEALSKHGKYDFDMLLFINTVYDLSSGMGCATFVVEKGRSTTGKPIFGRNFDWMPTKGLPQQSLVVVHKPEGKQAFAMVTIAPISGMISGMNESGLACSINEIHLRQTKDPMSFDWKGTPMLLLFRRVLEECKTVDEAEKLLRAAQRTTSACLTVCDAKGGAVFEITPKNLEVRNAKNDITCCTNHFCSELRKGETKCWRLETLTGNQQNNDKLTVGNVFDCLKNVNQKKFTLQTMVFEPADLKLHLKIGDGQKSATEFQAVALDLAKMFAK